MTSPTLLCQLLVEERKKKGLPVYNLGLGENPLCPRNLPEFTFHPKARHYGKADGIQEFSDKIKKLYGRDPNDRVLFGHGLKEMVYLAQASCKGTIIHVTPTWVSYYEQLSQLNKLDCLIEIETTRENGYQILPETLEKTLQGCQEEGEILLLFNNPNNPTGICHSPEVVERIAEVIRKFPNVVVFADDIYGEIVYDYSFGWKSISEYLPTQTIVGSSFSKNMGLGGYRCGWMIFPPTLEDFYQRCYSKASSTYSCLSMPIQYFGSQLLDYMTEVDREGDEREDERGEGSRETREITRWDSHLDDIRQVFKKNRDLVDSLLKTSKLKYVKPNCSWYFFVDFVEYSDKLKAHNLDTSQKIVQWLARHGVICVAGSTFRNKELTVRLSIVDFTIDDSYPEIAAKITTNIEALIKLVENL